MTNPCGCPDQNGFGRRVMLFGGFLMMFAGIAIKAFVENVSDWFSIAVVIVGGAMVPNSKVIELINRWRGGSAPAPTPKP